MYELVKKKSIGKRIGIGILVLFVVSQLLKFFSREPALTINDGLVKIANEINKHAPIIIDSLIRLDNVNALKGNSLQYNYTIQLKKNNIDTTELIRINREDIINKLKKDPDAKYFRDNDVTIQAHYFDKEGNAICTITVLKNEY